MFWEATCRHGIKHPGWLMRLMFRLCSILLCFPITAQLEVDAPVELNSPEADLEGVEAPEASGHADDQEPEQDELVFFNGNTLGGTLASITSEGVTWIHSDVEAPILFSPENLKAIQLVVEPTAEEELKQLARIELVNGDSVHGQIVKLGKDRLELTSPALGSFEVKREALHAMEVQAGEQLLYQGPRSGEWSFQNHRGDQTSWAFEDDALIAPSQNLSAAFEPEDLPDRITLSLDMEWRGNLNVNLAFWGADTENPSYNCYTLGLQHHYVRIHRNFQKHGHTNITNQQLQPQLDKGKTRITLHLDKATKSISLLLDHVLIGQWRDLADFPIRGDQIMFYNQSNSALRVSNIRIETWDGQITSPETDRTEATDEIQTVSGDRLAGTVLNIDKGVMTFRSEFAELDIPLERLQRVQFAASTRVEPDPVEAPVMLHSVAGDRLTLDLDAFADGVFRGSTPTIGSLEFLQAYVKEITLNPGDVRQEEKDWAWTPGF